MGKGTYSASELKRFEILHKHRMDLIEKHGYNSQWTLQKLENIQFYVDYENYRRICTLVRGDRKKISGSPKLVKGAHQTRSNWRTIVRAADVLNVPPELLIDEDFYFNKSGVAGYRILFAAHKKGVSLADLTYFAGQSDHPKHTYSWYSTWYMIIKGNLFWNRDINLKHFAKILKLCHERLDLPIGSLLGKKLHSTTGEVTAFGEFARILLCLDNVDCALVAGVARTLWLHRLSKKNPYSADSVINTKLYRDIENLLGWYIAHAYNKECRVSKSGATE